LFTLTMTQLGSVALVNQRGTCGKGDFWDIRSDGGELNVETDSNLMDYVQIQTVGPGVNDGKPHKVEVTRVGFYNHVKVDGINRATGWSTAAFGLLSGVQTGTDVCVNHTGDPTAPLDAGMITDLCVGPQ
jgi:hypothetical protein